MVKLQKLIFHLLLDIVAKQALAAACTSAPPFKCLIITSTASLLVEIVTCFRRLPLEASNSASCLTHTVSASRLLSGVKLALRVLIPFQAVFVPDLVHEVLVLEGLVQLHLLLVLSDVEALLQAVVEVKVRLDLLIKAIVCLLLELLEDGGVGTRHGLVHLGGLVVEQIVVDVRLVHMVVDSLLTLVDLLFDAL